MKNRWVGLGFVGFLACSSSESGTPAPAPDAGTNTTPTGTPMTIWVYAFPNKPGDPATPLAGATVAFDPPGGGERIEVTTEADGHATANMDFTKGTAVVSVAAPDKIVMTALEASPETNKLLPPNPFGKPSTDMVFVIGPNAKGEIARSVEISGKLTNKADPATIIGITTTGSLGSYNSPTDTYAARAPKGIPFSLLCFEATPLDAPPPRTGGAAALRLFRVDHAAVDANTPLDIDVSQGTLTASTVHWKIELPGGDAGPLGGTSTAFANIVSFDSFANVGFFKLITPTADKNGFDVEEMIAQTDIAPEVTRTIAQISTSDGAASVLQMLGNAPDGTVFKDFMLPPAVSITKQTRTDAFAMDGLPSEAEVFQIQLLTARDLEWVVLGPYKKKPTGPITLPLPPSTAQLPATLKAQIFAGANMTEIPGRPGTFVFGKVALSRPITVTK